MRRSVYANAAGVWRGRVDDASRRCDHCRMPQQAISVTLSPENITWLRGRVGSTGLRSVSELLDQLVTSARQGGHTVQRRSVVGTIVIDAADSALAHADQSIRELFGPLLAQPLMARESKASYGVARPARKKRG